MDVRVSHLCNKNVSLNNPILRFCGKNQLTFSMSRIIYYQVKPSVNFGLATLVHRFQPTFVDKATRPGCFRQKFAH